MGDESAAVSNSLWCFGCGWKRDGLGGPQSRVREIGVRRDYHRHSGICDLALRLQFARKKKVHVELVRPLQVTLHVPARLSRSESAGSINRRINGQWMDLWISGVTLGSDRVVFRWLRKICAVWESELSKCCTRGGTGVLEWAVFHLAQRLHKERQAEAAPQN